MRTNRTNIAITPAEAAELSSALFSSGSAAALELAPCLPISHRAS